MAIVMPHCGGLRARAKERDSERVVEQSSQLRGGRKVRPEKAKGGGRGECKGVNVQPAFLRLRNLDRRGTPRTPLHALHWLQRVRNDDRRLWARFRRGRGEGGEEKVRGRAFSGEGGGRVGSSEEMKVL